MSGLALKNAIRRSKREQRIPPGARCRYCGDSNPLRLMMVRGKQGGHHRTFRERDPEDNDIVCGSCQLEIHRRLEGSGIGPKREFDVTGLTVTRLRAMAVSYRMEADYRIHDAEMLEKWAHELERGQ